MQYELASREQERRLQRLDSASMNSGESMTNYAVGRVKPWRFSNLSSTWRMGTW